jgi:hypothetical protein
MGNSGSKSKLNPYQSSRSTLPTPVDPLDVAQRSTVWHQGVKVKFAPDVKQVTSQNPKGSFCNPGPAPKFGKNLLPLSVYLNGYDSNDNIRYGCSPGQYIKYDDGHYCCVDPSQKATPQEILDYINRALEGFFDNIGFSSATNSYTKKHYNNSVKDLDFLLNHRDTILAQHSGLNDGLEVPPDVDENGVETPITLDEWVTRFKMTDPLLVDSLEGQSDSELNVLSSMRNESKHNSKGHIVPLYTKRYNQRSKQWMSKFGGTKHKRTRNKSKSKSKSKRAKK